MKFSKITKFVYIFMWTGIFILSSYIIVKGNNGSMVAAAGTNLLKKGSKFLDYYSSEKEPRLEGVSWLFSGWNTGSYLYRLETKDSSLIFQESEEGDGVIIEYEEGNLLTQIPFISGESYYEEDVEAFAEIENKNKRLIEKLKKTKDTDFLLKNFYIVDSTTSVDKKLFQVEKLLKKDFTLKKKEKPQILIFHTHGGSESFSDSKEGEEEDSVIGVGKVLAKELEELGYQVIHDKTEYDRINGVLDRNKAYNQSLEGVKKQLEKYPSIQVIIDLHRDGVSGNKKPVTAC